MDQRVAFIADWLRDEWTMTELAARHAISRKTAFRWVERCAADPEHGLAERSRAPHTHGRAMADAVRTAVLAGRRAHPRWGPEAARDLARARAADDLAGDQHDWRSVAARGLSTRRAACPLYGAVDAALGGRAGAE